jgi:hypothetical protein
LDGGEREGNPGSIQGEGGREDCAHFGTVSARAFPYVNCLISKKGEEKLQIVMERGRENLQEYWAGLGEEGKLGMP